MSPLRRTMSSYSPVISACRPSSALRPPRERWRCSSSAASNPARSTRTPYSAASSTVRSIGKPYVSCSRNATSPGRTGESAGRSSGFTPPTFCSAPVIGMSASSKWTTPASRVRWNCRSSAAITLWICVAPLGEVRVGGVHRVDHDARQARPGTAPASKQPAVAHGASKEAAHYVSAPLVRRTHAVRHEECQRADVVGDDLVAEALRLERLGIVAEQRAHVVVDRREDVRVVVGVHALEHARQALEAHARVDALERQRHARAVGLLVELHEHEVPDLEPARAVLGVVGDAVRPLGQVRAAVEVDLAARSARSRVGHAPEVAVVTDVDVAPDRHALLGHADFAPVLTRFLVVLVRRRPEPLPRDLVDLGQQLLGPGDRLALEVVAEAPVAEHLEERVVARGATRPPRSRCACPATRRQRWQSTARLYERVSAPVSTSLNWTMPEFVKSSVWSPAGTSEALGTTSCPRSAKKSRKCCRISDAGIHGIVGPGSAPSSDAPSLGTGRSDMAQS